MVAKTLTKGLKLYQLTRKLNDMLRDPETGAQAARLFDENADLAFVLARELTDITAALDNSASNAALDNATGRGHGPCAEMAKMMADAYGADAARLWTGGSSTANLALAQAVRRYKGGRTRVLYDAASHLSVTGALAIADLDVIRVRRDFVAECAVQRPITADQVRRAIGADETIEVVWLTEPTYDGLLADLREIKQVCEQHGVLLLVDAAWGGFHGLLKDVGFPESAAAIADAAVVSVHKKGLGPSQMSVILFNDPTLVSSFDAVADMGFATTSPAYYALAHTEIRISHFLTTEGQADGIAMVHAARQLGQELNRIPGVRLIRPDDLGASIIADPCHVLVNTRVSTAE